MIEVHTPCPIIYGFLQSDLRLSNIVYHYWMWQDWKGNCTCMLDTDAKKRIIESSSISSASLNPLSRATTASVSWLSFQSYSAYRILNILVNKNSISFSIHTVRYLHFFIWIHVDIRLVNTKYYMLIFFSFFGISFGSFYTLRKYKKK